jgi:hypothetical protein
MSEVIEFPRDRMSARQQEILEIVHWMMCYPANHGRSEREVLADILPELEAWGAGMPDAPCGRK